MMKRELSGRRSGRKAQCKDSLKSNEAFSLIEIIVVVAICICLVALLFSGIGKARERAAQAKCMGQLRQIGTAFIAYAGENNGTYPVAHLGAGNAAVEYWTYFLAPYLNLKNNDGIGVTTLKCPTKSKYTNSMYGVNYNTVISLNPGQVGSAWLETGSKRLGSEVDQRAFLLADAFGAVVYTPTIWALTRDEDGDGVKDSNPIHPYNALDFRHNKRANFFLLNGAIVALSSAQWGSNYQNVWGDPAYKPKDGE